jgi:hypothetical protein
LREQKIKELIEQEESYIWTDDKTFLQLIASDFSKIIQNEQLRLLMLNYLILNQYYIEGKYHYINIYHKNINRKSNNCNRNTRNMNYPFNI